MQDHTIISHDLKAGVGGTIGGKAKVGNKLVYTGHHKFTPKRMYLGSIARDGVNRKTLSMARLDFLLFIEFDENAVSGFRVDKGEAAAGTVGDWGGVDEVDTLFGQPRQDAIKVIYLKASVVQTLAPLA